MNAHVRPPAHVAPYVQILGEEGAVLFLATFGGAELYFARPTRVRRHIEELVGAEKTASLAAAAPRLPRRVPTAKPWLARVLEHRGLSVAEIARRLHVTDVTVRGYLDPDRAKRPPPDSQPDLFD